MSPASERPGWIAPLYGYAVCLVAVITVLISATQFVDAAFTRASPLQGRDYGPYGASLTSFEAFRTTYYDNAPRRPTMTTRPTGAPDQTAPDTLTTAELRERYEALRADRIERATFESSRQLVKHGLLLLIAVGLFVTHWRWVRSRDERVGQLG